MKVTALLSLLTLSSAVSARSMWPLSGSDVAISEDLKVPGKNPLSYCAAPDSYLLSIDNVDLDPNPPEAGKDLIITANGTLSKDIEAGAKVHLTVKYGLIRILNQEVDLCDQASNVDLECPLKKGDLNLSKTVTLPNEIPPGKYTVLADVFTKDEEKVTCLTAAVTFSRRRAVAAAPTAEEELRLLAGDL